MTPRRVATVYAVGLIALVTAANVLFAFTSDLPRPAVIAYPSRTLELIDRVQFAMIGLLGAYLLPRVPRNRFVWVLLVVGAGFPVWDAAETYGRWRLQGGLPWDGVAAAWLSNWVWALTAPLAGLLFLLYPTGQPPSRRWWVVGWASLGAAGGMLVMAAVFPGPLDVFPDIDNPLGLPASRDVMERAFLALLVVQMLAVIGGAASVVVRLVRARGVERQQVKWFASAGLFFVAFSVAGPFELGTDAQRSAFEFVASVALTVAIGLAVTRYRLYEIDRILSRTLAHLVVVAILAAVYLSLVVGLGSAARALTGDSGDLVVALSTLAVAAVFQPVRRRVRTAVDRRFNRSSYDAARVVEDFGTRIRDEVDVTDVVTDLRAVALAAVSPRAAAVWLLVPGTSPPGPRPARVADAAVAVPVGTTAAHP